MTLDSTVWLCQPSQLCINLHTCVLTRLLVCVLKRKREVKKRDESVRLCL